MLDKLRNLVKGGRTGKATGLAAALLKIKPLLTVDPEGEVEMFGKAKSPRRAVTKLVDRYKELESRFGPLECCFAHTRNMAGVDELREAMIEAASTCSRWVCAWSVPSSPRTSRPVASDSPTFRKTNGCWGSRNVIARGFRLPTRP